MKPLIEVEMEPLDIIESCARHEPGVASTAAHKFVPAGLIQHANRVITEIVKCVTCGKEKHIR